VSRQHPERRNTFKLSIFPNRLFSATVQALSFRKFAATKADLVCDGVLPIDQLQEYTGPTALVVKRIPKEVLEATYGLFIKTKSVDEGGDGQVAADKLLQAYAIARGFMRSSQGNPDEARAARYILKDYVNGKLLFCNPPPGVSPATFNEATHIRSLTRAIGKKRAPATRVTKNADTFVASESIPPASGNRGPTSTGSAKSNALDQEFFEKKHDVTLATYSGLCGAWQGIHTT